MGVVAIGVDRFSPHVAPGGPPLEVSAAPAIFGMGTAYFVEIGGPPGVIPDARSLDLLRAQDRKYQARKVELGLA